MTWFRFHNATINNRKVQALSGDLFKFWVNLLCIASMENQPGGVLPPAADLAWTLREDVSAVTASLTALTACGLLDDEDGVLSPHEWDAHQYQTSTNRVQKHRAAKRGETVEDVSETAPLTVTETPRPIVSETLPTIVSETAMKRFSNVSETDQIQNRPDTETDQTQTQSAAIPKAVVRDFEAFQRAYPAARRTNINEAKREWAAAFRSGDLPDMVTTLRALNAHKESSEWMRDGGRFVPGMAKYIAAHMWEAPPMNKDPEKPKRPLSPDIPAQGKAVY